MSNRFHRSFLFGAALLGAVIGSAFPAIANEKDRAVQEISNHFASVPTMTGEFIQFGPTGEQTGGKFFIQRPGKIRFEYEDPSPLMVVSNGKTLGVRNKKLKTWQYIPLRKTPLSLLLSKEIKITDKSVRSVDARDDVTRVVMGDKNLFGDSEITLLFDPNSYDLRQWTIRDNQGKETSVMIFNVEKNVDISRKMFQLKASNKTTNDR
ncbi:MAG: outer membrane lipoprotein carrier protein LolA [Rhizobiaceae bacterium]|nr:outer membrane lipoprotein carrier protein LolA [Rhizobiaceae bacterium]